MLIALRFQHPKLSYEEFNTEGLCKAQANRGCELIMVEGLMNQTA